MNGQEFLVTLNAPPILEEAVVDCLLSLPSADGFSSLPVSAHSERHEGLSLSEQVTGRQAKIRFQMYLPQSELDVLLQMLRERFAGSGIQYWVMPVLDSGYI